MPTTWNDIASQIIDNLRLHDPDLDTSIGTTTRKIIDAVSESISDAYVDDHLLSYQYDIDAKKDADLNDFVKLFGMSRIAARRASGVITLTRRSGSNASTTVAIPVNTQVNSNTQPRITVITVAGAWMEALSTSVNVAAQAVLAGPSGNAPANSMVNLSSPVSGVGTVTNISPFTGGTDVESDEELRARWKATVFRSSAGTEDMYLGVALNDPRCYAANIIGASKKRREQVQIVGGLGQTTVDDAASAFDSPVFVGKSIDAGDMVIKNIDYSWDATYVDPSTGLVQPRLAVLPGGTQDMLEGDLFEVDFEYVPKASRNNAADGITNRVDIWTGGQAAATAGKPDPSQSAVQSVVFKNSNYFTNTALPTSDPLSRHRYRRPNDTKPLSGNIFVPLAWGPILTIPDTITVDTQVYAMACKGHDLGTTQEIAGEQVKYAYYLVHQDDAFGYTPTSRFGLEWLNDPTHPDFKPVNRSVFTIGGNDQEPYLYNVMVHDIQSAVEKWRLLGVDAKVHQAKMIQLRMSFAIMYDPRTDQDTVNTAIDTALGQYLTSRGFQGRVQVSDLLQVAHNVSGVDNIRFLNGSDYPGYNYGTPNAYAVGIQRIIEDDAVSSYVDTSGRAKDLRFGDNELPVYYGHVIQVRAENTFGSA